MRDSVLLGLLGVIAVVFSVSADEREEYRDCVSVELDRGTALAAIGELCLREIEGPPEPKHADKTEDSYPHEGALRAVLVEHGALLDPESARFKNLAYGQRTVPAWCGQLNAKNRLGGYVGWKHFALRDRYKGYGNAAEFIDFEIGGPELEGTCKNYGAWVREDW